MQSLFGYMSQILDFLQIFVLDKLSGCPMNPCLQSHGSAPACSWFARNYVGIFQAERSEVGTSNI